MAVRVAEQVSVVIVSHRTPALTKRAADSALTSEVGRVIVIDNASGDDTLSLLGQVDRQSVIESEVNSGFGTAANLGARAADRDMIVFLNSDAFLTTEVVRVLADETDRHGGKAIVGARLVGPDGSLQRSAGVRPAPLDLSLRFLGVHHIAHWVSAAPLIGTAVRRTRLSREYDTAALATEATNTSMVSGACFAIGRDAFWELGGFDERFFMYFEDADLCRRAEEAGMPIRYVPSAVVTHVGGASSEGDYHYSPLYARSMRQYLEKWWGTPGAALAILLLWLRLVGLALTLHRDTGQAFAALQAALRPEEPAGR
ncbi:MAG: glycosyltransferase family 2 protein [Chloroflexota bacterium]|nr:glycosyltransferase family 2 protein [Chloroflexota bacterium]